MDGTRGKFAFATAGRPNEVGSARPPTGPEPLLAASTGTRGHHRQVVDNPSVFGVGLRRDGVIPLLESMDRCRFANTPRVLANRKALPTARPFTFNHCTSFQAFATSVPSAHRESCCCVAPPTLSEEPFLAQTLKTPRRLHYRILIFVLRRPARSAYRHGDRRCDRRRSAASSPRIGSEVSGQA